MKLIYALIFVLFLILVGLLGFSNFNYKSKIQTIYERKVAMNEMVIRHSFYGGSLNLSPKTVLFNSSNQSVSLKYITNGKPKLVFRFTDLYCNSCIVSVLPLLKSFSDSIGKSNIVLFVSASNQKYSRLLRIDYDLDFPIYSVGYDFVNNDVEKLNSPYLFILNTDTTGNKIFIPEKSLPELTEYYFSSILELLK
ncbi:MAG: hypothetical protein ABFD10_03615 [Prolixibacteraceae bacterium]